MSARCSACLHLKGLAYEIDPITPFFGNDEFRAAEPAPPNPGADRRRFHAPAIPRSSAPISTRPIRGHAAASRRPQGPRPRALARGICRHAARRPLHLGPVLPEGRPSRWSGASPATRQRIAKTLTEDAPAALDYLEGELPADRLPVRRDRPRRHRDRQLLPQRAPMPASRPTPAAGRASPASSTARSPTPPSPRTLPFEDIQRSVDIKGRRQALLDAGAPLTDETLGTPTRAKA